ncbi:MAG: GyrI-like domain-containing protein [Sphingobacteriales bacterium]|nr:GyrI-like domain-containing protein [Sphingobacteriales bacterium]
MKHLRLLFFFALSLVLVIVVFSWLVPVKQSLEKNISIQAPAGLVFEQVAKLENFNQWSAWNQQDSTVKHTLTGTDGTVGAASRWKGDPAISGEGRIEISAAEPGRTVVQKIHFISPKESHAISSFLLSEANGLTTVTWHFEIETPRPWNIFNLFSDIGEQRGPDFEKGLVALKTRVEKSSRPALSSPLYEVKEMDFPATDYAIIRQTVKWSDIGSFYSQHLPLIYQEAQKQNIVPGLPAGLFYSWDTKNLLTDMAAALPLPGGKKIGNTLIRMENIPAGKAIYTDYYGAYDKSQVAWNSLRQYITAHNLEEKAPAIEQYITDPRAEKDTAKWQTRVIMLVE